MHFFFQYLKRYVFFNLYIKLNFLAFGIPVWGDLHVDLPDYPYLTEIFEMFV